MRIACSRCQAQYDLPDEKLERGAAKIRCTQCGHVFVVKLRRAVPPPPPPPVTPAEPDLADLDFNFDLSSDLEAPAPPAPAPEAGGAALPDANEEHEELGDLGPIPELPPAAGAAEAMLPDANPDEDFGDLGLDLGGPASAASPEDFALPEPEGGDVDLGAFGSEEPAEGADRPAAAPTEEIDLGELDLESLGLSEATSEEPPPAAPAQETSFDDFDFGSDVEPAPPAEPPEPAPQAAAKAEEPPEDDLFSDVDSLPSLGELDLGEFDDGAGVGFDEPAMPLVGRGAAAEPTEHVRAEDLVSPSLTVRNVPHAGGDEDLPRLDLQRGPRRADGTAATLAPDRRRSPLFWVVAAAVVATAGYSGYNAFLHREAFNFVNVAWIRGLLHNRDVEAKFATEEVKGYGQDLPGGRRVFVIRGRVVNKSGLAQGLIRVKGNLFGRDGKTLATSEVYCGNVLSERELAVLPRATLEARLQNQVGEALSNVDVAPGGKVPFMLVFPAPSARVENFNVLVSAWRGGS